MCRGKTCRPVRRKLPLLTIDRSPNLYDSGMYAQAFTTAPAATRQYAPSQSMSDPPPFLGSSVNEVLAKPLGSDSSIRVLNGSMVAAADNSQHSAIYYDTRGKNLALHRNHTVLNVELNSPGRLQETAT